MFILANQDILNSTKNVLQVAGVKYNILNTGNYLQRRASDNRNK